MPKRQLIRFPKSEQDSEQLCLEKKNKARTPEARISTTRSMRHRLLNFEQILCCQTQIQKIWKIIEQLIKNYGFLFFFTITKSEEKSILNLISIF